MPKFKIQLIPMRYIDTEILAQQLDNKLGPKNWKPGKVRVVSTDWLRQSIDADFKRYQLSTSYLK